MITIEIKIDLFEDLVVGIKLRFDYISIKIELNFDFLFEITKCHLKLKI
jgi:hypothetical protein